MSAKKFHNVLILLSSTFLITFVIYIVIDKLLISKNTERVILDNANNFILKQEKVILGFLDKTQDQLEALKDNPSFKTYLRNASNKDKLEEDFLLLAKSDTTIMQIRYLDADGYEKIRVDRSTYNQTPIVVGESDLQDKSHRYYFKDSKSKPAGEVWYSDLDLNIEQEKVQVPYIPTMRSILPLGSSDSFQGILVINYFIQPLFTKISDIPLYELFICDIQGNTLFHYNKQYSWSKYNEDKYNLKQLLPEESSSIINTIFFNGTHTVSKHLDLPINNQIISVLKFKQEYLDEIKQETIRVIFIELILFTLIVGITSYLLSKKLRSMLDENEEILKQKKLFNDTFNHAPIGIAHISPKGVWSKTNKAIPDMLGYTHDELAQLTFQDITYPEDLDSDLSYVNELLDGKIDSYQMEKRYLDKKGNIIWAELIVSLIRDDDGNPDYFISIINDISERKELEAKINEYLKLIDENIITSSTDTKGIITDVSTGFCKISGYSKEELIGKSHNIVRHKDMPAELYQNMWDTLKKDLVWHGEIKNQSKDGSYYWVYATITPIFDSNNNKIGYSAIRQLITDKKDLEVRSIQLEESYRELRQTQDILISQSRMTAMGEILSMIAHQWRQPLTVISSAISSLQLKSISETLTKEVLEEKLDSLADQTQDLSKTIRAFQKFYKPETEESEVAVEELIFSSLYIVQSSFDDDNIEIKTKLNTSSIIKTHQNEFKQAILAILQNAREALLEKPSEERYIKIESEEGDEFIEIKISDNAGGIRNKDVQEIFIPYFSTKEKNGRGLGLYMAKNIIENYHQGRLEVHNEGEWAVFTIKIKITPNQ